MIFSEKDRLTLAQEVLGDFAPVEDGASLWRDARDQVQSGDLDDRPLYWRRFALPENPKTMAASRNYRPSYCEDVDFRVLVTGFDPFNLDARIDQSNPSGVVALALDHLRLAWENGTAEIRSLIMPVRFSDFDGGLVESLIEPLLDQIDLLMTVSMGREEIDLERFPGLRRSSGKPDNARVFCGGTIDSPLIPLRLSGPEFLEFSLPVAAILGVDGPFVIRDNRKVTTLEAGDIVVDQLSDLMGHRAVSGSGGGYLSNEISYRAIRTVADRFPVGHIHTPRIEGMEPEKLQAITEQVTEIIKASIRTLGS